jgi:glycosyltransferase involved in cell wall biosynthesis
VKILHVINGADTGGAQTLLEALALERRSGDVVRLAVLRDRDTLSARLDSAMDHVTYIGVNPATPNLLRAIRAINAELRRQRVDILHSHLFMSDLAALLTPAPNVARVSSIHTSYMPPDDPKTSVPVARAVAAMSGRFHTTIATDATCIPFMKRLGYRQTPVVINNGVPIPTTYPPYDVDSYRVVSLARWHPMKAHDVLFAAFSQVKVALPDAKLVCAGSGMSVDNSALVDLLTSRGLVVTRDVDLLGPVDDVSPVLAGAGCLVLSSRYAETFPMVGGEATSRAIPVVTTRVGGAAAFAVRPEHVVAPESADALAAAIQQLLTSAPATRLRFSSDAREKAIHEFSAARVAKRYYDVYDRCMSARSTAVSKRHRSEDSR